MSILSPVSSGFSELEGSRSAANIAESVPNETALKVHINNSASYQVVRVAGGTDVGEHPDSAGWAHLSDNARGEVGSVKTMKTELLIHTCHSKRGERVLADITDSAGIRPSRYVGNGSSTVLYRSPQG